MGADSCSCNTEIIYLILGIVGIIGLVGTLGLVYMNMNQQTSSINMGEVEKVSRRI